MYKIKYQQKTIINLNTRQLFFTFNLFLDYDRLHKRDKRHRMEPVRIISILLFPHTYTRICIRVENTSGFNRHYK